MGEMIDGIETPLSISNKTIEEQANKISQLQIDVDYYKGIEYC